MNQRRQFTLELNHKCLYGVWCLYIKNIYVLYVIIYVLYVIITCVYLNEKLYVLGKVQRAFSKEIRFKWSLAEQVLGVQKNIKTPNFY